MRVLATAAVLLLVSAPAFARHSSSKAYPQLNDAGSKAYSHNGLPCSTASVSGAGGKADPKQRELTQIEHSSMTTLKNNPDHGFNGRILYHPAAVSERQPAINFVYHPPVGVSGGVHGSARFR